MSTDATFRMTVTDVFAVTGLGTVAVGEIQLGTIKQYDQVWLHGSAGPVKTGVVSIQAGGKTVKTAAAGQVVGLVLRGVPVDRVQVGSRLSASES